ncbi:MAG: hypothetical protein VKO64_12140 [Candidatus Sericytochromatia bacterium]|nr:hypothetical protein [Candidatus Sericytochromatia bacterium]
MSYASLLLRAAVSAVALLATVGPVAEARIGRDVTQLDAFLKGLPLATMHDVPGMAPTRMWAGRIAGLVVAVRALPARGSLEEQVVEVEWPEQIRDHVPIGIMARLLVEATGLRHGETLNQLLLGMRDRIRHGGVRVPSIELRGVRIEMELLEEPPSSLRDGLATHAGTLYWRAVAKKSVKPRTIGKH